MKWPGSIQSKQVACCCFQQHSDLAGINAFVLYKKRTGDKVSRRDFLFKLATELCEDYIVENSSRNATLARSHTLTTDPKKTKPRSVNSVK